MLIVIDGIDGSGKQTQTELLKNKLISKGKKVITYEFPNYSTFFGKMIREYLDGKFGDSTKVDAKLISILYALDRFEVGKEIRAYLSKGYYVLCDRYTQSNMAYQTSKLPKDKHEEFLHFIEEMEFKYFNLPVPNKIIFLKVPVKISDNNLSNRDSVDGHEKNKNYQNNVLDAYINLSKKYPNWEVIDCMNGESLRSIDEIHQDIINMI